jgi:hypothetical protein
MSLTEILISIVGALVGIVGYLLNRQLTNVDEKVVTMDQEFFKVKTEVLDLASKSRVDKSAMLEMLESEVLPKLKTKGLEEQVAGIRSDITILKEYQRNRISPALDKVSVIADKIERQDERQKYSDEIVSKMFEILKRIVEKGNKQ